MAQPTPVRTESWQNAIMVLEDFVHNGGAIRGVSPDAVADFLYALQRADTITRS